MGQCPSWQAWSYVLCLIYDQYNCKYWIYVFLYVVWHWLIKNWIELNWSHLNVPLCYMCRNGYVRKSTLKITIAYTWIIHEIKKNKQNGILKKIPIQLNCTHFLYNICSCLNLICILNYVFFVLFVEEVGVSLQNI